MLKLAHQAPSHEEVFLERYERLLSAASTLTAGDREAARDLVHDAYVQFVLARPPLEPLERVDGYLFITVRNLHISRARRATRLRHESLSMVDFDSAALGLVTLSDAHRLEATEELQRICTFALERRWLARSASAFLLHYFHEYPPSHVAQVLHTTPVSARKMLWLGRTEVRAALEDRTIRAGRSDDRSLHTIDCVALRDILFRAPAGPCSHPTRLGRLYGAHDAIDVKTLAHLVCCRPCLNHVNVLLGLPVIAGSGDGRGPDRPDAPSGNGSRWGAERRTTLAPSDRSIRATHEHHPKELRIAVNGLPIGMQRVAGPDNEVVVRLSGHDSTMFVEVFSEQEVRLLLLNAEPLASGAARQVARVMLSENRQLQAELDFTDVQPTVRVTYRDPSATGDWSDATAGDLQADIAESPALVPTTISDEPAGRGVVSGLRDVVVRFMRGWPRRPRRRTLQLAGAIALVWLLWFPPAAVAATAHRIYQAVVQGLDHAWHWLNGPSLPPPAPPSEPPPASPPPPPVVAATPKPLVSRPKARDAALPVFSSLELDAWYRAHLVGLVFDRDVSVAHTASGQVRMTLRIGNEYRRAALAARLEPWARQPAAALVVDPGPVDGHTPPTSATDSPSPEWLFRAFQSHYATHVPTDTADAVARDSVRAIRRDLDRQRAMAAALRAFATRWPSHDLDRATPDDVTHWATVIRDHALTVGEIAEQLRTVTLEPLIESATEAACTPRDSITTIHEVEAALTPLLSAADRLTADLDTEVGEGPDRDRETPQRLADLLCETEVAARAFAGPLSFIR